MHEYCIFEEMLQEVIDFDGFPSIRRYAAHAVTATSTTTLRRGAHPPRRAESERRARHSEDVIYSLPTPKRSRSTGHRVRHHPIIMDQPVIAKTASSYEIHEIPNIPAGLVSKRRAVFASDEPSSWKRAQEHVPLLHDDDAFGQKSSKSYIVVDAQPDKKHLASASISSESLPPSTSSTHVFHREPGTAVVTAIPIAIGKPIKTQISHARPKVDLVRIGVTPIKVERHNGPTISSTQKNARQEYREDTREWAVTETPGSTSRRSSIKYDPQPPQRESELSVELARLEKARRDLELEMELNDTKPVSSVSQFSSTKNSIVQSPHDSYNPARIRLELHKMMLRLLQDSDSEQTPSQRKDVANSLRLENAELRSEMAHLRDALESSTILLDQINSAARFSKRAASPTHESLGSSISDDTEAHESRSHEMSALKQQLSLQEQSLQNRELLIQRLERELTDAQHCNQQLNSQLGSLATNGGLSIKKEIIELKKELKDRTNEVESLRKQLQKADKDRQQWEAQKKQLESKLPKDVQAIMAEKKELAQQLYRQETEQQELFMQMNSMISQLAEAQAENDRLISERDKLKKESTEIEERAKQEAQRKIDELERRIKEDSEMFMARHEIEKKGWAGERKELEKEVELKSAALQSLMLAKEPAKVDTAQIQKLAEEKGRLEQEVQDLQWRLEKQSLDSDNELSVTKKQLADISAKLENSETTLRRLESEANSKKNELEKDFENIKRENVELTAKVAQLTAQLDQTRSEHREVEHRLKREATENSADVQQKMDEYKEKVRMAENSITELEIELSAALQEAENHAEALRKYEASEESQLSDLKFELSNKKQRLEELEANVRELQKELDASKTKESSLHAEVQKLSTKLESVVQQGEQGEKQLEDYRKKLNSLESQLEESESEAQTARALADTETRKAQAIQKQLETQSGSQSEQVKLLREQLQAAEDNQKDIELKHQEQLKKQQETTRDLKLQVEKLEAEKKSDALQLTEAASETRQLEAQLADVRRQLEAKQTDMNELQNKIDVLRRTTDEDAQRIKAMEREMTDLEIEKKKLEAKASVADELKTLMSSLQSARHENSELQAEVTSLHRELRAARDEIDKLETECDDWRNRAEQLESEKENEKEQLVLLTSAQSSHQSRVEELVEERKLMLEEKERLLTEKHDIETASSDKLHDLQRKYDALEQQAETSSSRIKQLEEEKAHFLGSADEQRIHLEKKNSELNDTVRSLETQKLERDATIQKLSHEVQKLETLEAENAQHRSRISELESRADEQIDFADVRRRLEADKELRDRRIEMLETRVNKAQESEAEKSKGLAAAVSELAQLSDELQRAISERSQLNSAVESLEAKLAQAEAARIQLETQLSDEASKAECQNKELSTKLAELEAEKAQLRAEVADLTEQFAKLQASEQSAKTALSNTLVELELKASEMAQKNEQLQEMSKLVATLQSDHDATREIAAQATSDVFELQESVRRLVAQRDDRDRRIEELESRLEKAELEAVESRAALVLSHDSLMALRAAAQSSSVQMKEAEDFGVQVRKQLEELDAEHKKNIIEIEERHAEKEKLLEAKIEELNANSANASALRAEIVLLKAELDSKKATIQDITDKAIRLETELEAKERDLEELRAKESSAAENPELRAENTRLAAEVLKLEGFVERLRKEATQNNAKEAEAKLAKLEEELREKEEERKSKEKEVHFLKDEVEQIQREADSARSDYSVLNSKLRAVEDERRRLAQDLEELRNKMSNGNASPPPGSRLSRTVSNMSRMSYSESIMQCDDPDKLKSEIERQHRLIVVLRRKLQAQKDAGH